jgi:hypothetical protein
MSERCVEIPVRKEVRDIVRRSKGTMIYKEYFEKIVELSK